MRHFDVQILGGVVLHGGRISEMKTGEGKTLVATLPAYLNALDGKGVHIVTVNDYLAKRDTEWMGQIYRFLGLSVGTIYHDVGERERYDAYRRDITYGTNNEFGFDYLRDNMKFRLSDLVQREFNYAIVDEVDSILIDEARTPLIISGPTDESTALYYKVDSLVRHFHKDKHYQVDEKTRTVSISETGVAEAEKYLGVPNLYDLAQMDLVHAINQSLKAHYAFQAGRRLHGQGRPGHHRRRIHRPADARPPLQRRPPPGPGSQGEGQGRAGIPDPRLDHLPELLPHVQEAGRDDGNGPDRGGGIPAHLRARRRRGPDQHAPDPPGMPGRHLPDGGREVERRRRGDHGEPRQGPPPARGHRLHREVRASQHPPPEEERQARRPQRQVPRAGGPDHRPGRAHRRRDHRHQHGRPRRGHPAGRQPRVPGPGEPQEIRHRSGQGDSRAVREGRGRGREDDARGARTRSSGSKAFTSSGPSATRRAGSTTSSAEGRAVRATPARPGSTCRSRTTSCGSSAATASQG